MYWETQKSLVLGHRGYSARFPENSILALRKAMAYGADGVEFDVRLSRDGKAVLLHDPTLDRTTTMNGPVAVIDSEELLRAKLGMGERIPSLREALDLVDGLVNIEVKDPRAALLSLELVRDMGLLEEVLFSSFRIDPLMEIRKAEPSARIGLLLDMDEPLNGIPPIVWELKAFSINVPVEWIPMMGVRAFISAAKMVRESGLRLMVWAYDDDLLQRALPRIAHEIDAVITDDPPRALVVLERMGLR